MNKITKKALAELAAKCKKAEDEYVVVCDKAKTIIRKAKADRDATTDAAWDEYWAICKKAGGK